LFQNENNFPFQAVSGLVEAQEKGINTRPFVVIIDMTVL